LPGGFQLGVPGQTPLNPNQPGITSQDPNQYPGGQAPAVGALPPGAPGAAGQSGAQGGIPNPAVNAINAMLRQPSPSSDQNGGAPLGAGGLAGVASNFKGPSIKVYKDQQKYQMWEFIFTMQNATTGQPGAPANPLGTPGQNPSNPLGPSIPAGPGGPVAPGTTPAPGSGSGNVQQQ
jgi:hypothetical protein